MKSHYSGLPVSIILFVFAFSMLLSILGYFYDILSFQEITLIVLIISGSLILFGLFRGQNNSNTINTKKSEITYYNSNGLVSKAILEQHLDICTHCNFEIYSKDGFCANCGTKLS